MSLRVYVIDVGGSERTKYKAWFDLRPTLQAVSYVSAEEAIGRLVLQLSKEGGLVFPLEIVDIDSNQEQQPETKEK